MVGRHVASSDACLLTTDQPQDRMAEHKTSAATCDERTLSDEIDSAEAVPAALHVRVELRQGDPLRAQRKFRVGDKRGSAPDVGLAACGGGDKHDHHIRDCDDNDDACCGAIDDDHFHGHDAETGKHGYNHSSLCLNGDDKIDGDDDDDDESDDEDVFVVEKVVRLVVVKIGTPRPPGYFDNDKSDGKDGDVECGGLSDDDVTFCGTSGAVIDVARYSELEKKANDVAGSGEGGNVRDAFYQSLVPITKRAPADASSNVARVHRIDAFHVVR